MNKKHFLAELEHELMPLKKSELRKFISYYEEMIDDYLEDGCTEEEAIRRIGTPGHIAGEILEDAGSNMSGRSLGSKILIGILLVLGSPLWGSLLLAALLLILSVYLILWCIPLCTGALGLAALLLALVSIPGSIPLFFHSAITGSVQLGLGLFAGGTTLLGALLTWQLIRLFMQPTKILTQKLTSMVYRRKRSK